MSGESQKKGPLSTSAATAGAVTIDQMIEHMTADLQSSAVDGQYIQLGYNPPPPVPPSEFSDTSAWLHQRHRMNQYSVPPPGYPTAAPGFNSFVYPDPSIHGGYILYNTPPAPPGAASPSVPPGASYHHEFVSGINHPQMYQNAYHTPTKQHFTTSSPGLIENLVGNWTPNTSGTYSPFGNTSEDLITPPSAPGGVKKPRMIAEVKPMRLRYSDVLAKSVPPTTSSTSGGAGAQKPLKTDGKKAQQIPKKITSTTPSKSSLKSSHREDFHHHMSSSPYKNTMRMPSSNIDSDDIDFNKTATTFTRNNNNRSSSIRSSAASLASPSAPSATSDAKFKSNNDSSQRSQNQKVHNSNHNNNNLNFEYRGGVDTSTPGANGGSGDRSSSEKKSTKKSRDIKTGKFGVGYDKPPPGALSGRRGQRYRRRDNAHSTLGGLLQRSIKQYLQRWCALGLCVIIWLLHLISDVCTLSIHLSKDLCTNSWRILKEQTCNLSKMAARIQIFSKTLKYLDEHVGHRWFAFWNRGQSKSKEHRSSSSGSAWQHTSAGGAGLDTNIPMPSTGEEAMKRLLACKGKDPYSILGVTPDCTDDDIKRYYKRQAFLVHPDKNAQPGAEEAFKILVHAFDIIGEPERRQSYDRKVAESHQVEQAWSELNDLLSQLHQKMEYAANTIRCTNCTKRHRRIHVERPCYAARMCAQCKIHHAAKEGDIWAESQCFGFLWYYYACMDGAVYDITEWASCQRANLRHLRPNTHQVQYRIVLGKQTSGGGHHHHRSGSPGGISTSDHTPSTQHSNNATSPPSNNTSFKHHRGGAPPKLDRDAADLEDLEEFLNNLYQKTSSGGAAGTTADGGTSSTAPGGGVSSSSSSTNHNDPSSGVGRSDTARNRKKNKRKK